MLNNFIFSNYFYIFVKNTLNLNCTLTSGAITRVLKQLTLTGVFILEKFFLEYIYKFTFYNLLQKNFGLVILTVQVVSLLLI